MPTDKQLIAFKIGARARKFLNEECPIEGFEVLLTAINETADGADDELHALLEQELEKYEKRVEAADV
ncbi:MAG: hypothetical protein ABJA67_12575 [Chthonomonadales bacterium]